MEVNSRFVNLNTYSGAPKTSNITTVLLESRTGFLYTCGSPATYLSIPAGTPQH